MKTDTASIAFLLADRPDEVADVFAMLATTDARDARADGKDLAHQLNTARRPISMDLTVRILHAGWVAGLLSRNSWGEFRLPRLSDRFDIARHPGGVLGWLRDRCGVERWPTEEQ